MEIIYSSKAKMPMPLQKETTITQCNYGAGLFQDVVFNRFDSSDTLKIFKDIQPLATAGFRVKVLKSN